MNCHSQWESKLSERNGKGSETMKFLILSFNQLSDVTAMLYFNQGMVWWHWHWQLNIIELIASTINSDSDASTAGSNIVYCFNNLTGEWIVYTGGADLTNDSISMFGRTRWTMLVRRAGEFLKVWTLNSDPALEWAAALLYARVRLRPAGENSL